MSTEHCIGLNDQRSSSRVLKPPVSNIIFCKLKRKFSQCKKKIDKRKKNEE